ncbi:hypothetical protein QR680_013828 [Steinernema hermaphroditum]|uniref:Fatty-acid and retinol-binding protein 1 n=1 Tax=Steinernema hermaphroditum TaxID=289476 RepID=A0AA39I6T4_9BILA|nr:hypothetical protein QR680_013828 [Steinernema hermaphroditum]
MSANFVVLLVLSFICTSHGLDAPSNPAEKTFYDVLPSEIKNFLKEVTPEDKKLIKELLPALVAARAANQSLTDLDVFEMIKPKSESLYNKVLDLRNAMLAHINKLPEKSRNFIKETYEKAWKGAQSGKDHVSQLMFLKQVYDGAKQKLTRAEVLEVYKEFPIVEKIFEDKDVKTLLEAIEGKSNEEVKQFIKEHNVHLELTVPMRTS